MEQDQSCTDTVIKGQHLTASVTNTRALWLLKSQDSLQWRWTMFVMQCEAKTPGWGRDRPPPRTTETRRCFALVRNVWGLLGPMTSHGVWWPILDLKKWIAWSQFYLAIHVTEACPLITIYTSDYNTGFLGNHVTLLLIAPPAMLGPPELPFIIRNLLEMSSPFC